MGFYVGLSTNGTPIDETNIGAIAEVGYDYVGISLDGIGPTHDRFRRRDGAFDASLRGIRLCIEHGIKVGLRFTLTQDNFHELPAVLDLMDREGADKFYLSHLNYAGRGNKHRARRRPFRHDAVGHGPAVRGCLDAASSAVTARSSSPATTMPTASIF